MTPFGSPVVPDVKMISARSSGAGSASDGEAAAGRGGGGRLGGGGRGPGAAPPPQAGLARAEARKRLDIGQKVPARRRRVLAACNGRPVTRLGHWHPARLFVGGDPRHGRAPE